MFQRYYDRHLLPSRHELHHSWYATFLESRSTGDFIPRFVVQARRSSRVAARSPHPQQPRSSSHPNLLAPLSRQLRLHQRHQPSQPQQARRCDMSLTAPLSASPMLSTTRRQPPRPRQEVPLLLTMLRYVVRGRNRAQILIDSCMRQCGGQGYTGPTVRFDRPDNSTARLKHASHSHRSAPHHTNALCRVSTTPNACNEPAYQRLLLLPRRIVSTPGTSLLANTDAVPIRISKIDQWCDTSRQCSAHVFSTLHNAAGTMRSRHPVLSTGISDDFCYSARHVSSLSACL